MIGQPWNPDNYPWKLEDRVRHVKDTFRKGTIKKIEDNRLSVMIVWDDMLDEYNKYGDEALDFQWANKIVKIED